MQKVKDIEISVYQNKKYILPENITIELEKRNLRHKDYTLNDLFKSIVEIQNFFLKYEELKIFEYFDILTNEFNDIHFKLYVNIQNFEYINLNNDFFRILKRLEECLYTRVNFLIEFC